jgi:ABC-2 type transport system permease protein
MKKPIRYYNYYLFTGLLIWNFFSLSLNKATQSIVLERHLIKKAVFPRVIIPVSIILSNFVNLVAAHLLFIIPIQFLGTLRPESIIFIIIGYVLLLNFTIGISLISSALNVRFRDVNFFVQAMLIVWFYSTPIVYSFSIIPYNYIWLWRLNPMTSILQIFQYAFIGYPMPGPAMLTVNIIIIAVTLITGIKVFARESKYFDDWI